MSLETEIVAPGIPHCQGFNCWRTQVLRTKFTCQWTAMTLEIFQSPYSVFYSIRQSDFKIFHSAWKTDFKTFHSAWKTDFKIFHSAWKIDLKIFHSAWKIDLKIFHCAWKTYLLLDKGCAIDNHVRRLNGTMKVVQVLHGFEELEHFGVGDGGGGVLYRPGHQPHLLGLLQHARDVVWLEVLCWVCPDHCSISVEHLLQSDVQMQSFTLRKK